MLWSDGRGGGGSELRPLSRGRARASRAAWAFFKAIKTAGVLEQGEVAFIFLRPAH